MAGTYRTFKFNYNTTTEQIIVNTANVAETAEELSVIRQTPTGERYKQIFGSGKKRWSFSFLSNTSRDILTVFQSAYNAQSSYDLTMSVEQDDGSYTDYDVIINQPVSTPDTIETDAIDRGLIVEVLEA